MTLSVHTPTHLPAHNRHCQTSVHPRCDFIQQGDTILRPRLLLEGWCAGYRITVDGRRQLTNLYLPGEIIGVWRNNQPSFYHSVMSITRASFIEFTTTADSEVAQSECALFEQQLENSIFRLGCLNAYERMSHLFLELGERLAIRGMGLRNAYRMPLTQELLADLVGISSVHVNRTLQQMRADNAIRLVNCQLTLTDPDALAEQVHYQPLL
ncbi:MAG: Crp/Fnr family transcriptional regulator [Blastomonas sp.]